MTGPDSTSSATLAARRTHHPSSVPDPSQCVVTAAPSSIAVSATATLTLQAKNSAGSNITVGGATVVFTAAGGTVPGVISATTDHGNGTYTATYTGTAAGTTLIGATINGATVTTAMPAITVTATVTSGFATPDMLNDADFETGWDGMTNWSFGTPTNVDRSTVHAFTGAFSVHRSIPVTSGSDIGAQFIFTPGANQDHVFYRTYFYLTAAMDGDLKFARWEGSNSGLGGLFIANGKLAWDFDVEDNAQFFYLVPVSGLLNGWHSVEVDYWRNGDPSGFPSAAIWLDGAPITTSLSTPAPGYWSGGRLYAGERHHTDKLIFCEWMATLNGTPANTVAADLYVDRLAVSSQRIGP